MATQIFINLPVRDLQASINFFRKLGYEFDPRFTDEKAACMIISEVIYVMLVTERFFSTFTTKKVADARISTEAILALTCEDRNEVDEFVKRAENAGANTQGKAQDHGFMYQHGFEDLDGHLWEVFWMNPDEALRL